jgi:anti-sigma regulatory factor (Ser/Thr protein kinase)
MKVRCDVFAPKVVRKALEQLPEVAGSSCDALLVASELVTNAVLHSRCPETEQLTVCARCQEHHLEISVVDPGLSGCPAEIAHRPPGQGGLGLKVVDELSKNWGTERLDRGYRVWADVPLESGAAAPRSQPGLS